MNNKKARFTDLATGNTIDLLIGNVGQHVFKVSKNVNLMNHAIRWCNTHDVGATLEHDTFKIELIDD